MTSLSFNPEEDDIDDDEYGHYEELQKTSDPTNEKMLYEVVKNPHS